MKNSSTSLYTLTLTILTLVISIEFAHGGDPPSKRYMVAAANPHAVAAGLKILQEGGSATDATIAAQMVLTLVEPQSSGIGGGAFLLHYQSSKTLPKGDPIIEAYDGRETAPKSVTPSLFLDKKGKKIPWKLRKAGGKGVGVPGVLRMLELAHKRHGKLPWNRLFGPAISLAKNGFRVTPRLHALIKRDRHLANFPNTRKFFYSKKGLALPIGHRLKNPILANTLRKIAEKGPIAFYTGPVAKDIMIAVNSTQHLPGKITLADISSYEAKVRKALCTQYREWKVFGMPPPTSGGIAISQILTMLERFDFSQIPAGSAKAVHLIAEASKLAFADRNHYVADSDFVNVPASKLLDRNYLVRRSKLISPYKVIGKAKPGIIVDYSEPKLTSDYGENRPISTSHISVVDHDGNAVSMTTSIGTAFGSRLMVRGFMLNDELTDFSPFPNLNGKLVANRVEPGKRPRSSMAPTIITAKDGKLVMTIGSPGGSSIIGYVTKTIIAALDWNMTMQNAIALPNFVNKNRKTELEKGSNLEKIAPKLRRMGHKIKIRNKTSGLHGIRVRPNGYEGGADPRREGLAIGE